MITMNDVVKGLEVQGTKKYNTDLFLSDVEILEDFSINEYNDCELISTDAGNDEMTETAIVTKKGDAFLITHTREKGFGGEWTESTFSKELTLKGYNYFTKNLYEQNTDYYNRVLEQNGYALTLDDVLTGIYNPEYKCTTLSFTNKNHKHWLTVNERGQLSSIKRKPLDREVGQAKQQSSFKSIFS